MKLYFVVRFCLKTLQLSIVKHLRYNAVIQIYYDLLKFTKSVKSDDTRIVKVQSLVY